MKIFNTAAFLLSATEGAWVQPKYEEVLKASKGRSSFNWGFPVGPRNSKAFETCGEPSLPKNALKFECNSSTCAVICQPGLMPLGKARVRCRKSGWAKAFPDCGGCDPEPKRAADVLAECKDGKTRSCNLRCAAGKFFPDLGINQLGVGLKTKINCKCKKRSGKCDYKFVSKELKRKNVSKFECADIPVTPGTTQPTAPPQPQSSAAPAVIIEDNQASFSGSCSSLIPGNTEAAAICNTIEDVNVKRALHHAPPLEVDAKLCADAQSYANLLAQRDTGLSHDGALLQSLKQGENLMFGVNDMSVEGNFLLATQMWHDEWKDWDFQKLTCTPGRQCLHFTQQVWIGTQKVCYAAAKTGRKTYVVARYSPPGNSMRRMRENVLPAN
ncbi:Oidioi.mRNA.OKI2018_I69.chr1.g1917.t1.cds [Oikopleura dioica]|uniref:Oidioi.mRNA.OKI2018_I69.chr1.g1917.t1.cds n=1 Tax=Oikopleura dioica TaxID=34765 RepID=A0ABN7STA7_OIKDI|nr:Oidioi.mRNA.OKI2018_I69.chr1.g1917.t1.cds [Oikopleura dioica]